MIKARDVVAALRSHYGPPPPSATVDAFELVLLENVAYLATPARRQRAFTLLKSTVGTSPAGILSASAAQLQVATAGGILKALSAFKLQACARIVLGECDGDLDAVIQGPVPAATRILRLFPGIGEPGAEKILLLTGRHPFLAPDSNALRVLERFGLIDVKRSYAQSYAAARAVADTLDQSVAAMQEAHALLQLHGRSLCKRSAPRCAPCPVALGCAFARQATPR